MSAHAAPVDRARRAVAVPAVGLRLGAGIRLGLAVAAGLVAICFYAGGGLSLDSQVPIEAALSIGGAAALCAALATERVSAALLGLGPIALLFGLAAFTAASAIWSVAPDASWIEGGRTLAYAFTFVGGVALARLVPHRWAAVLAGVLVAGLAVSVYALATRVFPAALSPDDVYARLREPFGYWNAVGLAAALGVPPCLWLGSRREGHAAVRALAYPAVTLLLVTMMLAYSRGALLALALGLGFYFATVPLRLRSLSVLALAAAGAAVVVAWDFAKPALTGDNIALVSRVHYGRLLGALMLGSMLLVYFGGLVAGFAAARWPPPERARRRAGLAVLAGLAVVPIAGALALSASARGLGGTIAHDWRALTDPQATTPPNDPSRLTAIGSVRARYWNDGLKIGREHPLIGVGAGGYPTARTRYRTDTLEVQHAHGYLIQTFADLGLAGLVLSLAFCSAWVASARRTLGAREASIERIGLLTMISVVIVFTFHSLIDWTWFIPGNAVVALLLGGWVAGRGPLREGPRPEPLWRAARVLVATVVGLAGGPRERPGGGGRELRARRRPDPGPEQLGGAPTLVVRPSLATFRARPLRAAAAAGALALALCVAWSDWQPLRSRQAADAAFAALATRDYAGAARAATTAASRDPLSVAPLFDLATIETAAGHPAAARAALIRAVRLTPADATTWEQLAAFDYQQLGNRSQALRDLGPALYLDPESHAATAQYLDTIRGAGAGPGSTVPPPPAATPAGQPAGTT